MQITFVTRKFRSVERNLHCDILHITTVRVARLVLDCNGVFAIKPIGDLVIHYYSILLTSPIRFNTQLEEIAFIQKRACVKSSNYKPEFCLFNMCCAFII